MGNRTIASGVISTALGGKTIASGGASTAMGWLTTASGESSTAMGEMSNATGDYSFAINLNDVNGPYVPAHRFQISGASAIGGNTAWSNWSDKRLKKEVQLLSNENNLEKIMQLDGVRFRWNDSNADVADRYYLGFLAQDVMEVIPEPVDHDELNDIYSIEYTAIIPVLVEAVKEQQAQIERLQNDNNELRELIEKQQAMLSSFTELFSAISNGEK
jgi:hypothetical protein